MEVRESKAPSQSRTQRRTEELPERKSSKKEPKWLCTVRAKACTQWALSGHAVAHHGATQVPEALARFVPVPLDPLLLDQVAPGAGDLRHVAAEVFDGKDGLRLLGEDDAAVEEWRARVVHQQRRARLLWGKNKRSTADASRVLFLQAGWHSQEKEPLGAVSVYVRQQTLGRSVSDQGQVILSIGF